MATNPQLSAFGATTLAGIVPGFEANGAVDVDAAIKDNTIAVNLVATAASGPVSNLSLTVTYADPNELLAAVLGVQAQVSEKIVEVVEVEKPVVEETSDDDGFGEDDPAPTPAKATRKATPRKAVARKATPVAESDDDGFGEPAKPEVSDSDDEF